VDAAVRPGRRRQRDPPHPGGAGGEHVHTAANIRTGVENSLRLLQTDHLDLIQLHAIGDIAELDKATGSGGALEAAIKAKDEGLVGAIGITGHGHEAPATHLEALRRFDFDTVLTPINYTLSQREDYYRDFLTLAEEIRRKDLGFFTIKSGALRNWPTEEHPYTTWYEPFTEQERITASVAWVLSHEAITGLPCSSDVRLLSKFLTAEREGAGMTAAEAATALEGVPAYSSPFINQPI